MLAGGRVPGPVRSANPATGMAPALLPAAAALAGLLLLVGVADVDSGVKRKR